MNRQQNNQHYHYRVVDVFTEHALEGNPLAVFLDASDLDDAIMQKIAREMNLSETVFVVPSSNSECSVGIRIFTPTKEMQFAGHPTIGASLVLIEEGIVPRDTAKFTIEERVGPVSVRIDGREKPLIWLMTPLILDELIFDRGLCARAIGLTLNDLCEFSPQILNSGNPTLFIPLKNMEAVDRAWIDRSGMAILKGQDGNPFCVFVFTATPYGAYSRMFAPDYGIAEDPATGSSTGPLAAFMIRHGLISGVDGTRFVSEQGTKMGRKSLLHVLINGEDGKSGIEVGGHVTPVVRAEMSFS